MNLLYIFLALYPVYRTGECVRGWDKIKKIYFQRLCVNWIIFFAFLLIRDVFYYFLTYFYILTIYDLIALGVIACSYTNNGSIYVRTFLILPFLRELRKKVYPSINQFYTYLFNVIKIRSYISQKISLEQIYDEKY